MKKLTFLYGFMGFLLSGYYATWQANLIDRGFDIQQISTILAISVGCAFLLEVPSGILADKLGHKATVLVGFLSFVFGFIIPSFSLSPLSLAAAVVVITVGETMIDGALDAWCSDIQHSTKGQITSHAFMSFDQAQRVGMVSGAILVPTLITYMGRGASGAWFVYAIIAAVIFLYAMRLPAGTPVAHAQKAHSILELKGHLGSKTLLVLLGSAFMFGLSDAANQVAFYPRIKEIGVGTPMLLGFVQAGMSLSRIAGLYFWKRSKAVESMRVPAIALIGSSIFFVFFAMADTPELALPIWFVRIMILSAYFSALRGLVQKLYHRSRWRATIMSAVTTMTQLGVIALSSGIGIVDGVSIQQICYLGGALALVSGVMFLGVGTPRDIGEVKITSY